MIDTNVKNKVHWLNEFAPKDCMHPTMGPSRMMQGLDKAKCKTLKVNRGAYCKEHDETNNSISLLSIIGTITLRPKNHLSSYYFMYL